MGRAHSPLQSTSHFHVGPLLFPPPFLPPPLAAPSKFPKCLLRSRPAFGDRLLLLHHRVLLLGSPSSPPPPPTRGAGAGLSRKTLIMYNPLGVGAPAGAGAQLVREPELPAAVGAELERLEARLLQFAGAEARHHLAELGEAGAARVLRAVAESRRVRTLSGFINYLAKREAMRRNARGVPTAHTAAACVSDPYREVYTQLFDNEVLMYDRSPNNEMAASLSNHGMVVGSPNQQMSFHLHGNGGSVRQIARLVPHLAKLTVESPCGHISSVMSQNQGCIDVGTPAQAMVSPGLNQMAVQIDSPARAMAPAVPNDVMMQVGSPCRCMPSGLQNYIEIDSPIQPMISTPRRVSTPRFVRDISRLIENMAGPLVSPPSPIMAMPQNPTTTCHATDNALREAASPQMLALEELGEKIENVLSVDYIRSLKFLSMAQFESQIWRTFGHKYIAASDRAKNLDSDPGMTKVYHCNVAIRGDTVVKLFKGPYIENTRTHLQKVVGDDNVLVVKFMGKLSDTKTDFSTYCEHYHKVAEDVYKDGGKEEKLKEEKIEDKMKCTSPVRCYFVRTESGWNMDEPYILSGRTVGQARELFMHISSAPTLAKYMARFALILSKTITLDVDLSAVYVRRIKDEPCMDRHGNVVHIDQEPLIHTDGTGLVSVDLALNCPTSILKGKFLKSQGIATRVESETVMRPNSLKRHRSLTSEHPLLMQFRLFYNGSAVKGTVLVDRRLPPGTILIRPSMVKIETHPELSGVQSVNSSEIVSARNAKKSLSVVQSVNSFEIVSTSIMIILLSNRPRRTLTSRFLITLLCYGGVPEEYFLELLQSAIEGAENACYDYEDALRISFSYADMEDSISARMILSGIPLEESYLQYRLDFMAQQERKGIKQGKIPIDECYYLMGTTDPTRTLRPNEVCVILENGQLSGDVLVYKHPGLHFGDIHVLKATYIKDLEKEYVGYAKYAILFPISGPRSLADEMANSDFDGDIYWVSKNPKLLEHFKPSEPWVQAIKPKKTKQKKPQDCNESKLERLLFHEFLKTRFTPSYALGTAADSWLAYMDRLLTDSLDESEKKLIEEKMLKLVDLYYLALDAPKTGNKVNIPSDLMVKQYPHFMGHSFSYHSSSILGQIYDKAEDVKYLQSYNVQPIVGRSHALFVLLVWAITYELAVVKVLLNGKHIEKMGIIAPMFHGKRSTSSSQAPRQRRYEEYLTDSTLLYRAMVDKEERNMKFQELYENYKHMLYDASEFEQTQRDLDDVFSEACVIYQIVYEKARCSNEASRCGFAWKVAGRALCHFYALKNEGDTALCSLPLLRKIIKKDHRR
uniref:RNA-dependent RNA polymerase n=1 Tax=Oryza punctata TaxID=4537 RepID=A0A0E0JF81_ORYPU